MPGFRPGDIVRVPFPYAAGAVLQYRPALVVGCAAEGFLLWVLMITSAENRGWAGDVPIPDHRVAGLPAPSVVRSAKIATVEAARAEPIGRIAPDTFALVQAAVSAALSAAER